MRSRLRMRHHLGRDRGTSGLLGLCDEPLIPMFVRLSTEFLDETRDRRGIKKSCVLGCKYIPPPEGGILHILLRLILEQLLQPLVLILRDFALGEQLL